MLNPAVQIIAWVTLVIILQLMQPSMLLALLLMLLLAAMFFSFSGFVLMLRRTRWIMISLMLIYACTTPGIDVFPQLGSFSPTNEGLREGAIQLGRLMCVLASLAILLSRLDQQKLVSGLYTLVYPLRYIGLSRERIAVRLALTLRYAESAILDTSSDWRGSLELMLSPAAIELSSIDIPVMRFTLFDRLIIAAGCASLVLVLL